MGIRLWPDNFENLTFLSKGEKRLLRNASRNFTDGHFVVDIDPMHLSKSIKTGMYISNAEGLVTFSVYDGNIDFNQTDEYITILNYFEDHIYKRLLDAKVLIARNGEKKLLQFPYKHMLVFPEQSLIPSNVSFDEKMKLNNYITYSFFRPMDSIGQEKTVSQFHIFGGIRKSYDSSFEKLSEIQIRAIFERLAPEYSIVVPEIEHTEIPVAYTTVSDEDMYISGKEVEYRTFCLDQYQVALVNDMGRGHRVILANPGSGKSVLLLARAFKYSSMFSSSKILLTCYNNNLADAYRFKENCAGFENGRNLFIYTFHKLVIELLKEANIFIRNFPNETEIMNCLHLIKIGKIKTRFKAIFIDEVQIFDPIYLEICYLLLESSNDAFIMTGDLNQTVRSSSRKGDVPWKKMPDISLDFKGRVKYIEKNYRNSEGISRYLKLMLITMNNGFDLLHLINPTEYEYNQFKTGQSKTIALKINTGISRYCIQAEVIKSIKEINQKYGVSFSDIAILFPFRQHNLFKYNFLQWLEKGLASEGIEYSEICSTADNSGESRTKYSSTSGVVLSTIDSCLGLDFRAVIVSGLFPLDYVVDSEGENETRKIKINTWESISRMTNSQKEKVQEQMRKVYTACSRARDLLYVISDLDPDSLMNKIIRGEA